MPVVHDSVDTKASDYCPYFFGDGRQFKYLDGTSIDQRAWNGFGMTDRVGRPMIDDRYISTCGKGRTTHRCNGLDNAGRRSVRGQLMTEDGDHYAAWLQHNLDLNIPISVDRSRFRQDGKSKHWNEE